MTKKEVFSILKNQGWNISYDDIKSPYPSITFNDRVVSATLLIDHLMDSDYFQRTSEIMISENLSLRVSVSTAAVCAAATYIDAPQKRKAEFCIMDSCGDFKSPKRTEIVEKDVIDCGQRMIDWASAIDIEAAIDSHRVIPKYNFGSAPLNHLAALAVCGDVETLDYYWSCFENGISTTFPPYITLDYIKRASTFASRRRENAEWMPQKPLVAF